MQHRNLEYIFMGDIQYVVYGDKLVIYIYAYIYIL